MSKAVAHQPLISEADFVVAQRVRAASVDSGRSDVGTYCEWVVAVSDGCRNP